MDPEQLKQAEAQYRRIQQMLNSGDHEKYTTGRRA